MNRTRIDWPGLTHTWNPIVGCKTGCEWCYAKRMNDRFRWIEKWEEPQFFPERLEEPLDKKPRKIFVGSMCDMFGEWIPTEWINQIIEIVYFTPQHEYMFLTKYPKRYHDLSFPLNVWLGTSVEKWDGASGINVGRLIDMCGQNTENNKFLSIEPLLGDFENICFHNYDLVIVGAMTGPGAIKPKKEWIDSIEHFNIYYKDNIKQYL